MDEWLKQMREHLLTVWGVDRGLVGKFALLYAYLWFYNLGPSLKSGYRSKAAQQALLDRWNKGDRTGIVFKPSDPANSDHCRTDFDGHGASRALDITTNNPAMAGWIAHQIGLRWKDNDPVHFAG